MDFLKFEQHILNMVHALHITKHGTIELGEQTGKQSNGIEISNVLAFYVSLCMLRIISKKKSGQMFILYW